jgi:hypothetical protein
MERKSQVQIPKDLLLALFQYHLAGNEEYLPEIEKALMEKLDSMVKRQLYNIQNSTNRGRTGKGKTRVFG